MVSRSSPIAAARFSTPTGPPANFSITYEGMVFLTRGVRTDDRRMTYRGRARRSAFVI